MVGIKDRDALGIVDILHHQIAPVAVNAAGAQFPLGHALIMNQYDVLVLMRKFPEIEVIATHVEGVSHATVTRSLLRDFARENQLTKLKIPNDGQTFSF